MTSKMLHESHRLYCGPHHVQSKRRWLYPWPWWVWFTLGGLAVAVFDVLFTALVVERFL